MQELFAAIDHWAIQKKPIALATVIKTWGSSPRGVGAKMAVNIDGDMSGSVSGGCVEGAVVEASLGVLDTGIPRLLHFGVSDENAWNVGLACGGEIEIFVRPMNNQVVESIRTQLNNGNPSASLLVVNAPDNLKGFEIFLAKTDSQVVNSSHSHIEFLVRVGEKLMQAGLSGLHSVTLDSVGSVDLFLDIVEPPLTLVIVGGVHIAIPLVTIANTLGFQTIIIDPRRKFANRERFPLADQIINAWPRDAFAEFKLTKSTGVAILTHDPKIDDSALEIAIPSPASYVGALGSKQTQDKRRERLISMGLSLEQLSRLSGPIGMDLGGRSPEEIALGIMAEIVEIMNRTRENSDSFQVSSEKLE